MPHDPPTSVAAAPAALDHTGGGEPPWHALPLEAVRERCASAVGGLSVEQGAHRRAAHGANRLPAGKGGGPLARLIAQFDNVLIYVLLGAGAIIGLFGHVVDAGVIFAVVAVTLAQFAFTYLPTLQAVFATRPVALADGLAVVGAGVALFGVLELEKLVRRRLRLGDRR